MEEDVRVPVYLITGFLESGKTSFIKKVVRQSYFQIPEPTVIINTEEGEVEYDSAELTRYRTFVVDTGEDEALTPDCLNKIENEVHPGRVMVELNPLWGVKNFETMPLPEGWGIVQEIAIVDASTYTVYRTNMKSLFVEMFANADLVMFNRCSGEMPLADFRRGIKVTNPPCEIVFENAADGHMIDIFEDKLPYDLDADIVNIEDVDYGIFYVDLRDNPGKYEGKTVHFRGKMVKNKSLGSKYFGVGWMAMTCCAADLQYIGYICESPKARGFADGSWVEVTAAVEIRHVLAYRGKGPVFRVTDMKQIDPPESELVYFN